VLTESLSTIGKVGLLTIDALPDVHDKANTKMPLYNNDEHKMKTTNMNGHPNPIVIAH